MDTLSPTDVHMCACQNKPHNEVNENSHFVVANKGKIEKRKHAWVKLNSFKTLVYDTDM